jgi:MFS family permease
MLGIAGATQFMSGPGQSYSVAAFKEPMRADLGISETNYSLAYGTATLVSGLCLPLVGRIVDRFGARRMLPVLALLLGLACMGMSRAQSLSSLYLGFSLIRSLGQGALTLVAMWIVGEWFCRRRGFAMALAGIGGSLSVMCFPLLNPLLIRHLGWQNAWTSLGVGVWCVLILPAIFVLRDRPEDLGLMPDGDTPRADPPPHDTDPSPEHPIAGETIPQPQPTHDSWSVAQVLRDATFWKLLSVVATSGMIITGLTFHQVALLGSRGISPAWALGMISLQALVATTASLPAGWLTDRIESRYLLATAMLLLASASALVWLLPAAWCAAVYAALLGLHGSILRSTGNAVWINYYGRKHQGSVRGVALSAMILAAAAGPLPLAWSIDRFQAYDLALLAFIAIPLAAAVFVWTAHPPDHPDLAGAERVPG